MKLILGLGNPGLKYKNTKHNTGKIIAKSFASQKRLSFILKQKFKSWLLTTVFKGQKIILALPLTFMNRSGQAVQRLKSFYKIKTQDILVIHDDADLKLGKIKLQFGRSSAGHHGVESIINTLGTNQFWRLRIGIRREDNQKKAGDFVLNKFSAQEKKLLPSIKKEARKKIREWIER